MSGTLRRIYRGETNIDFIGRRKLWFVGSALVLALCVVALLTRGLNYGIEFQGGVQIQAAISEDGPLGDASELDVIAEVRSALESIGAEGAQIQVATEDGGRSVLVKTKEVADPQLQQRVVSIVSRAVGATPEDTNSQRIGSEWGGEITGKALRALLIFFVVVFLFITWRFEVKMAVASLIALVHDLIITAGVYSVVGFEVTPSTVIAILTILGYSLYDTVVVFDKVEENTALYATSGRMTYRDAANLALNQVFMRSLNTSLSTLLPVAALLFVGAGLLGASTLKDLALALFVGLMVGSYSSVFIATPVLSLWKEGEQRFRNLEERKRRESLRAAPQPVPSPAGAALTGDGGDAGKPVARSRAATSRPPSRTRAGSKKVKRRKRR
ncbi:MAG TPA: protein translocase subunit SecF [Actinomycetota bacterium]|nr:protein translocase subunit SecF [Actinomycetota bacterium]